jgi:hypothetical protein
VRKGEKEELNRVLELEGILEVNNLWIHCTGGETEAQRGNDLARITQ